MSWRKDHNQDSAVYAFVCYAYLGCPTKAELEDRIRREAALAYPSTQPEKAALAADRAVAKQIGLLRDISAVNAVLDTLRDNGKQYIVDAVTAVYFYHPHRKLREGAIKARIRRFAVEYPAGERSVYRWLKSARTLLAIYREWNTYDLESLV